MKLPILTLLGFCLATSIQAQGPADSPPPIKRTDAELRELLGPIALYPDALVSLILPASTYPSDVVLGARYITSDGDPSRIEDMPWDSSVKALTRYPETLKWLDENLEWTAQVGDAFIEQPAEVMESIQQLRAMAKALGNLVDTPQQRIVQDDIYIRIIPAQPEYIYEPRYDPYVVYYERPSIAPLLYFSIGYRVGSWLNYDFDWHHHRLYRGDWHEGWDYRRDGDRNRDRDGVNNYYINNNLTNSRVWQPDQARRISQSRRSSVQRTPSSDRLPSRTQPRDASDDPRRKHHDGIARPSAIVGAPHHPETIKRGGPRNGDTVGNTPLKPMPRASKPGDNKPGDGRPGANKPGDNKPGDGPKGRIVPPKSPAPAMPGESKQGNERGERKKSGNEPGNVTRPMVPPPIKDAGDKTRGKPDNDRPKDPSKQIDPRKDIPKQDAPKRRDTPNQVSPKQDAPKQVAPKREEPKRRESPRQVAPQAAPKQDVPKRREAPKQVIPKQAPAKQVAPKQEAPKRREAPKQVIPRQAPAKQVAPKQEAPKRREAPKQAAPKQVSPKREAAKPQSSPTKAKSKDDEKKKEKK